MKRFLGSALLLALLALILLPATPRGQTYTITPSPFQTAFSNAGVIINTACIWTYTAGTVTPATTYSDNLGTQNTNPIRTDSAGRYTAFLVVGASYKFVYEAACTPPAHGTVLRTADNISAVPSAATNVDVTGTAGANLTAGEPVYLSDGSGGKVAGQWYPTDTGANYSSVTNAVGFATQAITSGSSGIIRRQGQVINLSGLTPGALYYASTNGTIQSGAPTINALVLGQADTTTSLVIPAPTTISPDFLCGRLSLTSGTPITTADVTAATTVFYEPDGCNQIALWQSGSTWSTRLFAQISIAVPATTNTLYDVWVFDNAGAPTLELSAWASTSVRVTSLGLQDGRVVKGTDSTRRYVGTFATTGVSGQTEDSITNRLVSNYAHKVRRQLLRLETTANWNYTTATVRQANNSTANQVQSVVGFAGALVDLRVQANVSNATGAGTVKMAVCVGVDSTTTCNAASMGGITYADSETGTIGGSGGNPTAFLSIYPAVGRHLFQWLEWSTASGTSTWHGTDAGPTNTVSGISGWIEN